MPESSTIGQRFMQLIQQLGLSKNAFAQSLDKTATVIQHIVDERNKPGYDLLCKVFEVYPNVSKDWLLLGKGLMLPEVAETELFAAVELATADKVMPGAALSAARANAAAGLEATEAPVPSIAQPTQSQEAPSIPPIQNATSTINPTVPSPVATSAAPDATYVAAMLQAQHLQHQLALAEQRNQHLLEQQQLLQQMVKLLQKA